VSHSHFKFFTGLLAIAAALMLADTTHAAAVTWSAPTNISGDSDVITTGTLVSARNLSQFQLTSTVNGVFFDIFPVPNGANAIIVGLPGVANFGNFDLESSDTNYGSTSAPFTGLSPSYQTILGSGAGSSSGSTLTLTLLGLTNGSPYLVQLWSNDSGMAYGGLNSTTASATNSVILDENVSDTVGGLGQWVSGTFIATGTSQVISLSGLRPELNAFQVRLVPEPGTLTLLVVGGLAFSGLTAVRRLRRA
jgi:hypothetical protein